MIRRSLNAAFFVCLVLGAVHARAGDWTRFRGPDGTGISDATTVPIEWTDKDYNWRVKLPGVGHSSPVLWGHRIYVTSGDPETAKRMVLCLDVADGHVVWQRDYPSKTFGQHRDNSYATATPTADADGVVVAWSTPDEIVLLALDAEGRELWRRSLGPFVGMHGTGTSPVLLDDLVVLANDQEDPKALPEVYGERASTMPSGKSFLIGVERKSGRTRWQIDRRTAQAAYCTPCVFRPDHGPPELIFTSTAHGITAVEPATGKVAWELPTAFHDRCIGSPAPSPGLVVAADGYGTRGTRLVAVRPGARGESREPSPAFEVKHSVSLVPTPLVCNGRIFMWSDDGVVSCLNASNGQLVWRERVGGQFYGSPVWVNHRLYCIARDGVVVVLSADDKFELLARNDLGEPSFTTPAIANGVMYLRTQSQLFSLGGKKP